MNNQLVLNKLCQFGCSAKNGIFREKGTVFRSLIIKGNCCYRNIRESNLLLMKYSL